MKSELDLVKQERRLFLLSAIVSLPLQAQLDWLKWWSTEKSNNLLHPFNHKAKILKISSINSQDNSEEKWFLSKITGQGLAFLGPVPSLPWIIIQVIQNEQRRYVHAREHFRSNKR